MMENLYLTKHLTLKYHIKGLTFVCFLFDKTVCLYLPFLQTPV